MRQFSVAVTEVSSRKICAPFSLFADRTKNVPGLDARAQLHQREEVRVQGPAADHVSARRGKEDTSLPRQQGPGQQDGSADLQREMRRDLLAQDVQGVDPVLVVPDLLHRAAQHLEDLDHHVHVLDVGEIAQHHGLVGQERRGKAGERGVLVPARGDPALEGKTAFDDVLVRGHWSIAGAVSLSATRSQHLLSNCACGFPAHSLPMSSPDRACAE